MGVWPRGKGPFMGFCTCGAPVFKELSDQLHKRAFCTVCGLEYGNRPLEPLHWRPRHPDILTDREKLHYLVDMVYDTLVGYKHQHMVNRVVFFQVLSKYLWSKDHKQLKVVSRYDLKKWGYELDSRDIWRR